RKGIRCQGLLFKAHLTRKCYGRLQDRSPESEIVTHFFSKESTCKSNGNVPVVPSAKSCKLSSGNATLVYHLQKARLHTNRANDERGDREPKDSRDMIPENLITRKKFLYQAGLLGVAAAASLTSEARVLIQDGKKIRVGIIGCGSVSTQ